MKVVSHIAILAALGLFAEPALAGPAQPADELPAYLECVPYAREVSGIQIYGDAHTWWDQAAGRYQRGHTPKAGAVMAFEPYGNMRLGHVAAVSKVIDSRTVLLRHSNWSPIDGRRGQVEDDVRAVDVSPNNDWSQVRVWYAPLGDLGTTAWPVEGFIYPGRDTSGAIAPAQVAAATPARKSVAPPREFLAAFEDFAETGKKQAASKRTQSKSKATAQPVDLLEQLGG
ncbi:CHAP domain-containing protein [Altererythrobacter salegens]|uniref:CHAP domain-containing protein n=1 Tax=Croceibacterium salegens TaxID=1737568 RepID=A0A6I4SRE0_9SPHN|nr:CHAP domain-containing protein [Croceibacterium salegens]MXO58159.1 CHAP domain-containing protein [Croceibacterium salegens]